MKRLIMSLAILATPALAVAAPTAYDIDGGHSSAQFSVKHLMVSTVRGEFGKVAGALNLDDADVTKSSVEATIDAASINTRDEKRDGHLKSPEFFDTAKFPNLTFKSTKVEKAGKDKLKVTGDLTMHGVTKPVVLDVEGPTAEMKDPWGNVKRGASGTTKISRKDFGISWNKSLDQGGVVLGDEVAITLDLELNKKMPAAAPAIVPAAAKK